MKGNNRIRGRFAPTPSGRMHLGNAFAALLAWLDIRVRGGELLLRMEDLDPDRCRPEYAGVLAKDLRWLGLDWDLGWQEREGEYLQSARADHYKMAFHALEAQGLLYPCYCNRRERLAASAPHTNDGAVRYNGRCRHLTKQERMAFEVAGRRPAWRVRVPEEEVSFTDGNFGPIREQLAQECGDFILRRSDGVYAYQLAVVADDGEMGITRVVRGRDLLSSTPRQLWLFGKLGYQRPEYCHAPLLTDTLGRRLSKRERDLDLGMLRSRTTPEALIGFLAHTAGMLDRLEAVRPQDLIEDFSWEKVGREDRVVAETLPDWLLH